MIFDTDYFVLMISFEGLCLWSLKWLGLRVVPSQNSFSFLSCIQLEWVNDLQLPLSIPPSLKFKNKYSRTPKKKNTLETMSAPLMWLVCTTNHHIPQMTKDRLLLRQAEMGTHPGSWDNRIGVGCVIWWLKEMKVFGIFELAKRNTERVWFLFLFLGL